MSTSMTSPRRLRAAELRREALRMRREGATHGEIADWLNLSRSRVHRIITEALESLAEDAVEESRALRALEAERLDMLQHAIWDAAMTGDLPAIDRVLRISERRAKLLGLDAPAKYSATDPTGDEERPAGVIVVPAEKSLSDWMAEFSPENANALEVDSEPQD